MKIAVLGTGNVGGILATRWSQSGHQVVFGSRTPEGERVRARLSSSGPAVRALTVPQAAAASDVVVLAAPWQEAERVLQHAGDMTGKVLIDCTNPLNAEFTDLDLGYTTSAAERIACWAPGARVVKAFNTVSAAAMANPVFGDQRATLFYCGDDEEAKVMVHQLAEELGFEPVDTGRLRMARYLEPLAMLYIHLAMAGWGSNCAFTIVKREG